VHNILLGVLICYAGGSGTTEQAQPVVNRFMRHMERAGGWKADSLAGTYLQDPQECQNHFKKNKPQLLVVDLPSFLARKKQWGLRPVAHMGKANSKRYFLLVRKGSFADLQALKGQSLVTPLAYDPRFISKVIFGGKVGPKYFKLEAVHRPLKGLRRVARKKAAATLVDEVTYRYLSELKLPQPLTVLQRSAPLPGLTLAVSRYGAKDRALRRRIKKALPRLCVGDGQELCKTFQVTAMVAAQPSVYKQLQKLYD